MWEIVEKMRDNLNVKDELYDPLKLEELRQVCVGFQAYVRNIKTLLASLVKDI